MDTIGLVGAGPRSDIIAHLIDRGGGEILLWHPDDGSAEGFPEAARSVKLGELAEASLIFVCLPLHRIRETARRLGDVLDGRHVLVHTTRTLEYATLEPISTMLADETPTRRLGFISGPMRRADVLEDRGGSAVCASPFPEVADMVEEALTSDYFRVYRNDDMIGSEAAATYARVIGFVYGMGVAMGLGKSVLSTLFTRGLDEVSEFVDYQGGDAATTFGLAGTGNLHADTSSEGNTDFQLGALYIEAGAPPLAEYRADLGPIEDELFGLLETLIDRAETAELDLRILEAVRRGVYQGEGLEAAFDWLMALPNLHE
jgi:glycerol-3-phosphate dehydrogenase (NAD(P)+)